jgi:hypothetical protein
MTKIIQFVPILLTITFNLCPATLFFSLGHILGGCVTVTDGDCRLTYITIMNMSFHTSMYSGDPKSGQIRISDGRFSLGPSVLIPTEPSQYRTYLSSFKINKRPKPSQNRKPKSPVLGWLEYRTVRFSDPYCISYAKSDLRVAYHHELISCLCPRNEAAFL